jgi:hypothetical protein
MNTVFITCQFKFICNHLITGFETPDVDFAVLLEDEFDLSFVLAHKVVDSELTLCAFSEKTD